MNTVFVPLHQRGWCGTGVVVRPAISWLSTGTRGPTKQSSLTVRLLSPTIRCQSTCRLSRLCDSTGLLSFLDSGRAHTPFAAAACPKTITIRSRWFSSKDTAATTTTTTTATDTDDRKVEQQDISNMSVGDIKKELESMGMDSKIHLEKSELIEALKMARSEEKLTMQSLRSPEDVDKEAKQQVNEAIEAEVLTNDTASNPTRQESGPGKQQQQQQRKKLQSPYFGGGFGPNPFPGGVPGMGAFGNLFGSNLDKAATAAQKASQSDNQRSNPFGGGGGDGGEGLGSDPSLRQKAEELLKNPQVQDIMTRAQSNPRIAAILQECVKHPAAAIVKYKDDPDLRAVVMALAKYV